MGAADATSTRSGPRRVDSSTGRRGRDGGRVLVLNATYEPINVCTVRRAAVLLLKEKAELRRARRRGSCTPSTRTMPRPVVIRLRQLRATCPRDAHRRKITRRAVFARDGWTCQYCGSRSDLTVDHVIPRSKGGDSSWENIVASCAPCNRRKGDRLPRQAGMHPAAHPGRPTPTSSSTSPPHDPQRLASLAPGRRTGVARRRSAPGRRDRFDVPVVGPAASAEELHRRQHLPQRRVVPAEGDRIALVEVLGLVQLGVAERRRVDAQATDPIERGLAVKARGDVVGWRS